MGSEEHVSEDIIETIIQNRSQQEPLLWALMASTSSKNNGSQKKAQRFQRVWPCFTKLLYFHVEWLWTWSSTTLNAPWEVMILSNGGSNANMPSKCRLKNPSWLSHGLCNIGTLIILYVNKEPIMICSGRENKKMWHCHGIAVILYHRGLNVWLWYLILN